MGEYADEAIDRDFEAYLDEEVVRDILPCKECRMVPCMCRQKNMEEPI